MNEQPVRLWLAELRSGRYRQGTGQLRQANAHPQDPDLYCCLGIVCELFRQHTGQGEWVKDEEGVYEFYQSDAIDQHSTVYLPREVVEWIGEDALEPTYLYVQQYRNFAKLNDDGVSFSEIADQLEAALEAKLAADRGTQLAGASG